MGDGVELDRRGEVAAERLFDDDARVLRQPGRAQALDHGLEQRRRNGEVMRRPLRRAERGLQRLEGRRVLVVAADVAQQAEQACRRPPDRRACRRARRCRARAAASRRRSRSRRRRRSPAPSACRFFTIWYSAGKICLLARSPVKPKTTSASECAAPAPRPARDRGESAARSRCALRGLFDVAAELVAHGRKQLVGEAGLAARAEALVQRGAQHVRRHRLRRSPPRSSSGPRRSRRRGRRRPRAADRSAARWRSGRAATSRSRCRAARPRRCRAGSSRIGRTRDCAAASSRRRPRASRLPTLALLQDVEALGVGGHHAVLDAVVDHLHEVAGAVRAAVQEALLGVDELAGCGRACAAPRRRRARAPRRSASRRADHLGLAADHQAVAAVRARRRRRWCRRRRSGWPAAFSSLARRMSSR